MRKLLPFSIFAFLLLILFSGCFDTPKSPIAPNWDVDLNVPITEKEYKMADFLKSSNNITTDGSDSIYLLYVNDIGNSFLIQDGITVGMNVFPDNFKVDGDFNGVDPVDNAMVYEPDPDYHIISAEFKSGSITVTLHNDGDTPVNYEIVLPGFKYVSDNNLLLKSGTLSAHDSIPVVFDLQGCKYNELPVVGINDKKTYKYQASEGFYIIGRAKSPDGGAVNINLNSGIKNDIMIIKNMKGRLKTTELPDVNKTVVTSFGNDIENFTHVDFNNIGMDLKAGTIGEMQNIKITLDSISIVGYKVDANGHRYSPVRLILYNQQYYSTDFVAGEYKTLLPFNSTNSNLIDFLHNLPKEIDIKSKAVLKRNVDDPDSLQVISSQDSIKFAFDMGAHLSINVNDIVYRDTINIDDQLTQSDRDNLVKANNANLTFEITNNVPLRVVGKATFTDEKFSTLFSMRDSTESGIIMDSLIVSAAATDDNGVPISPGIGNMTLLLNKSEIEQFKIAKYIVVRLTMDSYNHDTAKHPFVKIRAIDKVKIKLYGGVNYHLSPDSDDEGGTK